MYVGFSVCEILEQGLMGMWTLVEMVHEKGGKVRRVHWWAEVVVQRKSHGQNSSGWLFLAILVK